MPAERPTGSVALYQKISERGEHADSSPLELLFEQNFTDVYGMRALKYLQKNSGYPMRTATIIS